MTEIHQNENNFELTYNGEKAGEILFNMHDAETLNILHTEVDEKYSGQGFGKKLVAAVADFAGEKGFKIMASCPYAKSILDKDQS